MKKRQLAAFEVESQLKTLPSGLVYRLMMLMEKHDLTLVQLLQSMIEHLEKDGTVQTAKQRKIIGNFLQWLESKGYIISDSRSEVVDMLEAVYYAPVEKTINQWLANYFGIELDELELERQALNPLQQTDEE